MSRFKRTDQATPNAHAVSSDSSDDFEVGENREELQARLSKVQEKRLRCEFELEKTKQDIRQCEKDAQALGVTTLDELEALVAKMEEEDRQKMESFMKDLFEEENTLTRIEQQLAELEQDKQA